MGLIGAKFVLLSILAGFAVGATVRDGEMKLKINGAVLLLFVMYAAFSAEVFVAQAVLLYLILFFMPFSIASWFQRRFGKRNG